MINPANVERMVRHIEIKAYVDDYQSLCTRVAELASKDNTLDNRTNEQLGLNGTKSPISTRLPTNNTPIDRVQDDTFFHCRSGRLKLRSSGQYHDLIYYRRENEYGPSESFYQSARTVNPAALRTSLTSAFGEAGRVKKFRRTYRIGHSIVHLDRVGGLGDFIEIKVELSAQEPASTSGTGGTFSGAAVATTAQALSASIGAQIVENLMSALGIDLFQLVDGAYVDLINERDQRAG